MEGREIATVAVVGRSEPVTIFEPRGHLSPAQNGDDLLPVYAEGLKSFRSGDFPSALAHFERIAEHDRPAAVLAERCRELLAAPPKKWDGVWALERK